MESINQPSSKPSQTYKEMQKTFKQLMCFTNIMTIEEKLRNNKVLMEFESFFTSILNNELEFIMDRKLSRIE